MQPTGVNADIGAAGFFHVSIPTLPLHIVTMGTGDITIRASAVTNYTDCPRRAAVNLLRELLASHGYEFRHLLKSVGSAVGTAAHAGACAMLAAKKNGSAAQTRDATDLAVSTYKKESCSGIQYDNTTQSRLDAESQIARLTNSFAQEILPRVTVSATEAYREASLLGATITGHVDLRTDRQAIMDWKFGAIARHYHGQVGTYSLLDKSAGLRPERLAVGWLPRVGPKKAYPGAKIIPYDVDVCERAAAATIGRIIDDCRRYQASQDPYVFPANRSSMLCSERYCSAFGTAWCEESKCG
jgi:hypothetical protein